MYMRVLRINFALNTWGHIATVHQWYLRYCTDTQDMTSHYLQYITLPF